MKYQVKNT